MPVQLRPLHVSAPPQEIHEKYRTPWKTTILNGIFVAAGAALLPLDVLAEVTNIGTLFAFCVVCVAVLVRIPGVASLSSPPRSVRVLGVFVPCDSL